MLGFRLKFLYLLLVSGGFCLLQMANDHTKKYSPSKDMNLRSWPVFRGSETQKGLLTRLVLWRHPLWECWASGTLGYLLRDPAMHAVLTFIAWMPGLGRCYLDLGWNILPDKKLLPRWYAAIRGLEVALVLKRWQSNPTLRFFESRCGSFPRKVGVTHPLAGPDPCTSS